MKFLLQIEYQDIYLGFGVFVGFGVLFPLGVGVNVGVFVGVGVDVGELTVSEAYEGLPHTPSSRIPTISIEHWG